MNLFGWISPTQEPPPQWDLRRLGWQLSQGENGCRAECKHILICDVGSLTPKLRSQMAEADRPAWRLIMLGVEDGGERAHLLGMGCAEALPSSTSLKELTARSQRVTDMFGMLPRWRELGPLTLDLFHRDARQAARWLNMHPREFGLLWRLADNPGERVTRKQLLQDVWRISHDPQTNSVEVHISRLRNKLASVGCGDMVKTAPEGGYVLTDDRPFMFPPAEPQPDALDRFLSQLDWNAATEKL